MSFPWAGGWSLPVPPPTSVAPSASNINIINVIPAPNSYNVLKNQTFTFTIKSKFFPISLNSVYIFLDNQVVVNGATTSTNFTVIRNTEADGISLDYSITPNYNFSDGDVFSLQVYATDGYGNPSYPFWAGYVAIDARPKLITPIYPLDGYTNVPTDLTLHFLLNQLIAPGSGLIASTLNVSVNSLPAITNGTIQPPFDGIYSAINSPAPGNITSPYEVLLDYDGRYDNNDIVTVNASAKSIIIPVVDNSALFLNAYGSVAVDGNGNPIPAFSVSATSRVSDQQQRVTLSFTGINPVAAGFVTAGYQLKNSNGNIFSVLDVVDGYHIDVTTIPKTFNGKYSFVTSEYDTQLATPVFAGYFQGVYMVDDLGDGYHINVSWHPARTTRPDYDLAYLVYYSTTRSNVFLEEPKLITQGRKLSAPENTNGVDALQFGYFAEMVLPVGTTYYFGVRATEYPHNSSPIIPPDGYGAYAVGLIPVDGYSFQIPTPQLLLTTISGTGALVISVNSTAGFAAAGGFITVGAEIMRYASLTSNSFVVASTGRGQLGTSPLSIHNAGELVKMFYGSYDDNTVIAKGLVTWDNPNDPHRSIPDLVTTDLSLEDGYNATFEPFDYSGYHQFRPDELFSDDQCNTYVGGEYNGHRGMFLTERLMANEEQLLEVTGESVILLKRIWSGEICICRTSRKDAARVRSCSICFGTGFKGGFTQYINPRRLDKRIRVHFAPSEEELKFSSQGGIEQGLRLNAWTLNLPAIKDRDVLIRFDQENTNKISWIYIINSVTRGETVFSVATRQRLNISRVDRQDVIYGFKYVL